MFGILGKWLPRQQGARDRTSFFVGNIGHLSDIQAPDRRRYPEPKLRCGDGQGACDSSGKLLLKPEFQRLTTGGTFVILTRTHFVDKLSHKHRNTKSDARRRSRCSQLSSPRREESIRL